MGNKQTKIDSVIMTPIHTIKVHPTLRNISANGLTLETYQDLEALLYYNSKRHEFEIKLDADFLEFHLADYMAKSNHNTHEFTQYIHETYKLIKGIPFISTDDIAKDTITILKNHGFDVEREFIVVKPSILNHYARMKYEYNWIAYIANLEQMTHNELKLYSFVFNTLLQCDRS
jgi:hypothetical protein